MKQIIWLLLLSFSLASSKEYTDHIYKVSIDVKSTKANEKAWDFAGGSPDILLLVNGKKILFDIKGQDKYRCVIEFIDKNKYRYSWYFEIYDRDLSSDDLIGKGDCHLYKKCSLGRAKILIEN